MIVTSRTTGKYWAIKNPFRSSRVAPALKCHCMAILDVYYYYNGTVSFNYIEPVPLGDRTRASRRPLDLLKITAGHYAILLKQPLHRIGH